MTLPSFISQYFPIVLAIVGTIALALGSLSKYRETRMANMLEATTTWRGLAESRQAALEEERNKNARLLAENDDLKRQTAYWWEQMKRAGHAGIDELPPPPERRDIK
jgi:hypothetical protein